MIGLEAALAAYARVAPLEAVDWPLERCLHRVLRAPLKALADLPRHSQSALDGYVLTIEDAARSPCTLRVAGEIAAGDRDPLPALRPGECLRIFTGARVPTNAGAVTGQERTAREGDSVRIITPLPPGANIRVQGEEQAAGAVLAEPGLRLRPGQLSAAAAAGHAQLRVGRPPRIALLVSGDELRPAGAGLAPGQIWDSNTPLVRSWLAARGLEADAMHLPDDRAAVRATLDRALSAHDLVLTTGGVSVGDRDYILPVAEELGVRREFWNVRQKPGKPMYFGARGSSLLLGCPGNPAAVLVGLYLHLEVLLDALEGAPPGPRWRRAALAGPVKADAQRDRLVRMQRTDDDAGFVRLAPLPHQDSHMLSNLLQADALALLPARAETYARGEVVRWIGLE